MGGIRAVVSLVVAAVLLSGTAPSVTAEPIRGAGSTFAAPVIAQWARAYKDARADGGDFFTLDWTVDYEPVGSLAGVMRLQGPEMDFAATDTPLSAAEVAKRGAMQFPIVMGGIAVVANVEGIASGTLRLDGPLLADIFSGAVGKWSDARIASLNPGVSLPERDIAVLARKDGSGSTFTFTSYLAETSPAWKERFGTAQLIEWPKAELFEGSRNLVAAAQSTPDSITYVEFGQVSRAGLPVAQLLNQAGQFVLPSAESFDAGLSAIDWQSDQHFAANSANMPGEGAYPIAAVTYAVVPLNRGQDRIDRVLDLFRLAFSSGDEDAVALGYVPVPDALTETIAGYWAAAPLDPGN